MKRFFYLILAASIAAFTFTGCGDDDDDEDNVPSNNAPTNNDSQDQSSLNGTTWKLKDIPALSALVAILGGEFDVPDSYLKIEEPYIYGGTLEDGDWLINRTESVYKDGNFVDKNGDKVPVSVTGNVLTMQSEEGYDVIFEKVSAVPAEMTNLINAGKFEIVDSIADGFGIDE